LSKLVITGFTLISLLSLDKATFDDALMFAFWTLVHHCVP
jgi:hypothetical protein